MFRDIGLKNPPRLFCMSLGRKSREVRKSKIPLTFFLVPCLLQKAHLAFACYNLQLCVIIHCLVNCFIYVHLKGASFNFFIFFFYIFYTAVTSWLVPLFHKKICKLNPMHLASHNHAALNDQGYLIIHTSINIHIATTVILQFLVWRTIIILNLHLKIWNPKVPVGPSFTNNSPINVIRPHCSISYPK